MGAATVVALISSLASLAAGAAKSKKQSDDQKKAESYNASVKSQQDKDASQQTDQARGKALVSAMGRKSIGMGDPYTPAPEAPKSSDLSGYDIAQGTAGLIGGVAAQKASEGAGSSDTASEKPSRALLEDTPAGTYSEDPVVLARRRALLRQREA